MRDDPIATTRAGAGGAGPGPRATAGRPLVSIVIATFDGLDLLGPCLDSVRALEYPRTEVVLVDNASTDGTAGRVADRYPEVRVVRLGVNAGFAGGSNAGIARARGDYVLLLNNDATLSADAVDRMVDFMESHPRAGLVGPLIVREDDPSTVDSIGLAIYPDGTARGAGRGEPAVGLDGAREVFCPSGCACLCRREVLEQVGPLDEDFHLMLEDADLGWRARLAGWECYCVPSAVARHRGSATIGRYSARKAYYVERNRIWLAVKYFPPGLLWRSPFYSLARYAHQAWAMARDRGPPARPGGPRGPGALLWATARAYCAAARGLPPMLERRRRIARGRRVADAEVLEWFDRYRLSARALALTN